MNKPTNTTEVTLWSEASLQGNPMRKSCHPAMLSNDGYVVTLYPKVRKQEVRTEVRVKYDRTFIAEKFVKEFLVPLGIDSLDKFTYLLRHEINEALEMAEFDAVHLAFAEKIIDQFQAVDYEETDGPF